MEEFARIADRMNASAMATAENIIKSLLLITLSVAVVSFLPATIAYEPITTLNCGSDKDCQYGYFCSGASAYSIGQCVSRSGTSLPICTSNSDCSQGQTCAKDFQQSGTYGSCVTCAEHWALKQTDGSYCWQDSSSCGTQYNLKQPQGFNYLICQTQQQGCVESWVCGAWIACQNGQQDRGCTDVNGCGTMQSKPITTQACQFSPPPTPTPTSPTQTTQIGLPQSIQIFNFALPTWFLVTLLFLIVLGIAVWSVKKR